ncbi:hypothetical protein GJAV_G00108160 [Gymnothorax javanicus]|nr:hypothetical protein GJAV_G00108160 [Gymnothorax javanicus]
MITRGCFLLALLANYALSLPVSSHHVAKEDVKVMKCIVEVIADALAKPDPIPVSQDCLDTLRTDDRLISILRRQDFLDELREIAVQGANERALQQNEGGADRMNDWAGASTALMDSPDRSMLVFLQRPEERAVVSAQRGREGDSTEREGDSQQEEPKYHITGSSSEVTESRDSSERDTEDETVSDGPHDSQAANEGVTALVKVSTEVRSHDEEEEPGPEKMKDELSEVPSSRKQGEREEQGGVAWEGIPHHSKEQDGEEAESAHRSPEELQLQTTPRREEEGSANRRAEDQEVESLAAIESELESVAQKLHELRRG